MNKFLQILGVLFIIFFIAGILLFVLVKNKSKETDVLRKLCQEQVINEGRQRVKDVVSSTTKGSDGKFYTNNMGDITELSNLQNSIRDNYRKCLIKKGINEVSASLYTTADFK